VVRGATVALVEVMKTFTPVRAPVGGTWVRRALLDGDAVDAGQTVGWIRPD
jgi:biotin carboxyl carrier protein